MSKVLPRSACPGNPLSAVRTNLASLILRAGLAAVFLYHGLEKVLGPDYQYGAAWMDKMFGLPADAVTRQPYLRVWQLLIAWGEVVGGGALAVGLLTRLAALAMILIQCGATFYAVSYEFFSMTKGGGPEYNFVLIAMCATLLLLGAGHFSADYWLFKKRQGTPEANSALQPAGADLVPAER